MAFEWTPEKENALYESWWSNVFYPAREQRLRSTFRAGDRNIDRNLNDLNQNKYGIQRGTWGQISYTPQWTSYLNSYLQTQVQESQQQAEAERAAQQAVMAKAEQDYAAAAKQAEESQIQAKRISAVADYQGQQLTQQARQASALAMQSEVQPVQGRRKTQIGQPGVSRTRVSSGIGIGGYGGTSAGNVNPTGLNI
jgi:ATP-dependent Clp protease ATP-binding subunit ClpA